MKPIISKLQSLELVTWVGIILLVWAFSVGIAGYIHLYDTWNFNTLLHELYEGITIEPLMVAITVIVIDRLIKLRNERRDREALKQKLMSEMASPYEATTINAANELRAHGWLEDGSLQGVRLDAGSLKRADLSSANMRGHP